MTPEGRLFIQSAQIILSEYNKIRKIPAQFNRHENLSVSCTYSALFTQTFIQFLDQYPAEGCRDTFKETGLIQVIQDVVEQRYRMAIFYCFENREPLLDLNDEEKITYIFDRGGLFDAVKTGPYISVVAKSSISISENSKVIALPLNFDKYIGVYLMKSQSYQMSVREKSFIRYLKKALKLSLDS